LSTCLLFSSSSKLVSDPELYVFYKYSQERVPEPTSITIPNPGSAHKLRVIEL
jgi:hypothetical protein